MRIFLLSKHVIDFAFLPKPGRTTFQNFLLVLLGSFFLIIAAKISMGFSPIPMDMENLADLFIGMAFGWRIGGLMLLCYFFEGLLGVPVLGGWNSAGFILGAFPAVIVTGYLIERGWGRNNLSAAMVALIGMAIIDSFGFGFLVENFGWSRTFSLGLPPFVFVDMLKILFLSFLIPLIYQYKEKAGFYSVKNKH